MLPPATAPPVGAELVQPEPVDVKTFPAVPGDVKPVPPLLATRVDDRPAAVPVVF